MNAPSADSPFLLLSRSLFLARTLVMTPCLLEPLMLAPSLRFASISSLVRLLLPGALSLSFSWFLSRIFFHPSQFT
ncbi:hypothetical protein DEU56DRAFT_777449 [Suillus clintonianus]|uniref:uncharacterized protein n=1 Tax=Suillus clintonianus TaxID=1904413 RepID=UPI001B85D837|nr:uncharacterized protein DEU56DRAFT_777449 [Suillus clintonianus]KAG2151356.1 hypothetical protein DEU56DRAFT_777449 [Suillus clintonianus]